jgi:5-methyltetrahydropteroyltriglutamate--homocysteine methyltransferase
MLEHYRFLHDRARRGVAKLTIPSPSALLGRPVLPPIDARVYPSRTELYADLGEAYRAAVRAFAAAGCRYLQLDEVFIAMLCDVKYREKMVARGDDPDALLHLYARLINTAIADAPEDMTITLHLCRGNFKSTFMGEGGYAAVQDVLFNEIDVHGYFMEYDDERSGGFEPLRSLPKGKHVVLGLVTTKRGELESKDELKRRIDAAARFVDLDQLCLSPQCGFASTEEGNLLTEDEQWAKLALVVEVAAEVWG